MGGNKIMLSVLEVWEVIAEIYRAHAAAMHKHECMCKYVRTYKNVCVYDCMYTCMYACMYVCT